MFRPVVGARFAFPWRGSSSVFVYFVADWSIAQTAVLTHRLNNGGLYVLVLLPENRFVKHKFWQQRDVNLVRCLSVRCKIIITIMKEQINNIFCLNPDNCLKRYLVYIYTWRLFCLLFPFLTFSLSLSFFKCLYF